MILIQLVWRPVEMFGEPFDGLDVVLRTNQMLWFDVVSDLLHGRKPDVAFLT